MGYWDYYDSTFRWGDDDELRPNLSVSRQKLADAGMSEAQAQLCVESGFVYEQYSGHIIDRYHGGPLVSTDSRTRFRLAEFVKLDWTPRSRIRVRVATSFDDVRHIVGQIVAQSDGIVLFRGQTQHHALRRACNNPFLNVPGLGESSLMPSLWRIMQQRKPDSFLPFRALYPLEWSLILDSFFDRNDIERRMRAIAGDNIAFYSLVDFEECDDSVLQNYAKCQLDLMMGMNVSLADLLATLLQHYGLLSPVLDLTASLEVALFFATHRFMRNGSTCTYQFVGTDSRQAVVYVLARHAWEMAGYQSDERLISFMRPLRPIRQECEICRSSTYAINLPADFVTDIVRFDFDALHPPNDLTSALLFPADTEDAFLRALKSFSSTKTRVTDFDEI